MTSYRIKIFNWGRFPTVIGWFALTNIIIGLWHPLPGFVILFNVFLIIVILYLIFVWRNYQQMTFLEPHLQIGKTTLTPENIKQIKLFLDKHRVIVELAIDNHAARPRYKGIWIRPLENRDAFYQKLNEWAKEHHVMVIQ